MYGDIMLVKNRQKTKNESKTKKLLNMTFKAILYSQAVFFLLPMDNRKMVYKQIQLGKCQNMQISTLSSFF